MSTTVTYKGSTLTTVSNDTATLETSGTWMEDDITLTDVTSSATLGTKTITANGTYNASSDSLDGYSQVTASVPNTYAAGDEGKVVQSGALVSQTSATYTTNDTYDTTTVSSVTVNVSGGGGGNGLPLIDTITVPSDTRAINIDLTTYSAYNVLIIVEDTTLSASDWLYYAPDTTTPSGGGYSDGSKTDHKGVCMWKFLVSGSSMVRSGTITQGGFGTTNTSNTDWNNLYIYTYSAGKSIKAGSTYKVYGSDYADL